MKAFHSALQSILQNKLRSVLAGFGISWGVLLIIIFLGVGNGFRDGIIKMLNAFAQKSLFVYGGQTSIVSGDLNEDTQIIFDIDIVKKIKQRYGSVMFCSTEMSIPSFSVSWNGETSTASVKGVNADYFKIRILEIKNGRSISRIDDIKVRNVAVIGDGVSKVLFGSHDPIGKMFDIGGSLFRVIGVLSSKDLFSVQERNSIYVPASSFVSNFNSEGKVTSFCLSLEQDTNTSAIEKDLKGYLAHHYDFNSHDNHAIHINNIETQTKIFESLFYGLEVLIWIVGICLLLSGIVGVCNVMQIVVKERTNEIGIRKAVGANSGAIISMIIVESVTITFIAGSVGIVLGALVMMLTNSVVLPTLNSKMIDNLSIDIPPVLAAFVILCLSGVAAGLFPAIKASKISPVDAIRYENRG